MRRIAKLFGGIVLFLFGMVLITALGLFIVGAYLTTYPLLRLSPRDARLRAGVDAAMAITALVATLRPEGDEAPPVGAPNDT